MVQNGAKVWTLPRSASPNKTDEGNKKEDELSLADQVTDGSVSCRGTPALRSKTGNWIPCFLIFGCEVCERVAFYAISANLVTYLTIVLREDVSVAVRNVNNWMGTTFLTPLIGAFIADAFLGRYWTLASFSCGYFVALVFVVMSVSVPVLKPPQCNIFIQGTCIPANPWQITFFYCALYMMALGAGGIKACVAGFAGDQFDEGDVKEHKRKMSFMNWWFVSISFGTMLSVSCLVWIQITMGYTWGYGIPAFISAIATAAYLLGTPLYRNQKPTGSPLTRVAQVIVAAIINWNTKLPNDDDLLHEIDDKEYLAPAQRRLPHSNDFRFLDKAAVTSGDFEVRKFNGAKTDPWRLCSVTQVEEVKLLIRMLPIWVTNLMFSAVFAQVGTLFLSQGTTMDRHVTPNFQIAAASFPLFITATICALLPLYDKFLVPFARRFTGNKRGLTLLQRIGVGQVISTLSIALAAVVEMKRMRVAKRYLSTVDANGTVDANTLPMSIFWLLPQYMLIGASEVFISVGQCEFFYDQVPDSMRSVGAALYLSTVAIGSFVSSLLVTIVTKLTWNSNGGWIGNDLNRCHIDYFYWLLVGLSTLNLLIYVASAKWYRYKQVPEPVLEASSSSSPQQYSMASDNKGLTENGCQKCVVKTSVPYDLSPSL
ncbi:unnamed protein product [Calypogeia fissa]